MQFLRIPPPKKVALNITYNLQPTDWEQKQNLPKSYDFLAIFVEKPAHLKRLGYNLQYGGGVNLQ